MSFDSLSVEVLEEFASASVTARRWLDESDGVSFRRTAGGMTGRPSTPEQVTRWRLENPAAFRAIRNRYLKNLRERAKWGDPVAQEAVRKIHERARLRKLRRRQTDPAYAEHVRIRNRDASRRRRARLKAEAKP